MANSLIPDLWNSRLSDFAQYAEEMARASKTWRDDSGSADDAITAYVVGHGKHDKNFGRDNWKAARESDYISPRWENPASNFTPVVMQAAALFEEKGVILTTFVRYGARLEMGIPSAPPSSRRLSEPQDSGFNPGGTFANTFEVTEDDFVRACGEVIGMALAMAGATVTKV